MLLYQEVFNGPDWHEWIDSFAATATDELIASYIMEYGFQNRFSIVDLQDSSGWTSVFL